MLLALMLGIATTAVAGHKYTEEETVMVCLDVQDKDEMGFIVENVKDLKKSRKGIKKRIDKQEKYGVRIVEENCQMTIRVVYRGEAEGAPVVSANHGFGLVNYETPKTPIVRALVIIGDKQRGFEGQGLPNNAFAGFGRAESNIVDDIADWIKLNREALLNLR